MTMRNRNKTIAETHEFEGELDNGYWFTAEVSVEFVLEDEGIGSYEFWGTTYYDENYQYNPSSFFIEEIILITDEEGETIMEQVPNTPENKTEENEYLWDQVASKIEGMLDDIDTPDACDDADVVYDYDY